MKLMRVPIILTMAVIIFFMVSCPGAYDSRRLAAARRNYLDFPSPAAQKDLEDAKANANRGIVIIESFFAIVVISLGVLFYKMEKNPN